MHMWVDGDVTNKIKLKNKGDKMFSTPLDYTFATIKYMIYSAVFV